MPEPAVYRTESAQRAHRRRQLRDAIREELRAELAERPSAERSCACGTCTAILADALTDRILDRFDRIEADQ